MDFILEDRDGVVHDLVSPSSAGLVTTELDDLQLALVGGGIGDFIAG